MQTLANFKIEKNKTTEQELVDHLGQPASTTINSDGSKVLTWSGGQSQTQGAGSWGTALISIVPGGILFAHEDMNVHTSSIMVTVRNGVVVDYTVVDSNQKTHLY
jgi:hypothetical protein